MVRSRWDDDADIRLALPQPQAVNECGRLVTQTARGLDLQTDSGTASQTEVLVSLPSR